MKNFDPTRIKWVKSDRGLADAYYKLVVPSITGIVSTIPDPDLDTFIKNVGSEAAERIMTNSANRGTSMHLFIENFLRILSSKKDVSVALKHTQTQTPIQLSEEGIPQDKIDEGRDLFYKFYYSQFPLQYHTILGLEYPIYSPSYFFRGKIDVLFKDNVYGPSVTDFKTCSEVAKKGSVKEYKYKIQIGGYSVAIDEMLKSKNITVKKSSLLFVNTQNEILNELICVGDELETYKSEFKKLVLDWHVKNGQEFLIKTLL
jgi:hypothetical protein